MMIIDDGSTDGTQEAVVPYVQSDLRIIYLRSDKNIGHLAARNISLDHLPQEVTWITQLDSEDIFPLTDASIT